MFPFTCNRHRQFANGLQSTIIDVKGDLGPYGHSPPDFRYISVADRAKCLHISRRWVGHPQHEVGACSREVVAPCPRHRLPDRPHKHSTRYRILSPSRKGFRTQHANCKRTVLPASLDWHCRFLHTPLTAIPCRMHRISSDLRS